MWILILIAALAYFIVYLRFAPTTGSDPTQQEKEHFSNRENYRNGRFHNPVPTNMHLPLKAMGPLIKFNLIGKDRFPGEPLEVPEFDPERWRSIKTDQFGLVWLGHSSLMFKLNGKTILIDPVLSKRASMFRLIGPKRFPVTNRIKAEDLPQVDILLLTHDHYDHLDYFALKDLKDKVGEVVTSLGVRSHLRRWGWDMDRIRECGWGDITRVDGIDLICCEARHFSGRRLDNRFTTLWSSWVIRSARWNIYHGADSGYHPGFSKIGQEYGPFDLATLECGAYSEFWPQIHMFPHETVQAGVDLGARVMMPIHWGKFSLGPHAWNEPPRLAEQHALEKGLPLFIPRLQEVNEFQGPYVSDWWR